MESGEGHTIVYLWDAEYQGQRLNRKLAELKVHLAQYFDDAFELAAKDCGVEVTAEARQTAYASGNALAVA